VTQEGESGPISDIHALVDILELSDIVFYALTAERDDVIEELPSDPNVNQEFGLRVRHDGREYGARIRAELSLSVGRVVVDVAAEYAALEPFDLDQDVAIEFANDVAIMALLPYVREAVSTLTSRVFGQALTMPIVRRGQIQFTLSDL
jgi:hypothetical protein